MPDKSQTHSEITIELSADQKKQLQPLLDKVLLYQRGVIVGSVIPKSNMDKTFFTYAFVPAEIADKIINLVDEYTKKTEVENA